MFTTRPELRGTFAMVSSTHYLASASAMAVLEDGGNAFDAAVAGALVLQVVEPHLNGPGGDLPAIVRPAGQEPVVLCGQGVAPAGATIEHYRAEGLDVVPGTGLLAAAVPGAMPAWITLLRDHGTRTPREVAGYALSYARDGHPLIEGAAATIGRMASYFTERWQTSAAQWLPGGTAPAPGQFVRNGAWATTLDRLLTEADAGGSREAQCDAFLRAWSSGFVAEAIERFVAEPVHDTSGEAHAGVLAGADLGAWSPTYENTWSLDWRGHRVYKCGPWTRGPALLQQLALLSPLLPDSADDWSADLVHTFVEGAKLAFADRDAFFGDSGDDLVTAAQLLDPSYLDGRRALVGEQASLELRPGRVGGREPRFARAVRRRGDEAVLSGLGEPTVRRDGRTRGDTCHIDVVDRWGNAISATPSGGWLQSSPYIPELGSCPGPRLQMCWLDEGLPPSLQPGRRPRTTLTPSLAVSEDETLAFGTPGGDQQEQWQLVFWLARTVLGRNLQEAIDAPSWHTEHLVSSFEPRVWQPGVLVAEDRLGAALLTDLEARGHLVTRAGDWALGRLCAASHGSDGLLRAAANPRGMQGYAVGR